MSDEKIESIIDNINITEEIEMGASILFECISNNSLSRRAAFFGCIRILMIYANQKKWTSQQLKDAISKFLDLHILENDI